MKKLATILALTAVVANLGVASVFAQVVTGTQDIDCETFTAQFETILVFDDFILGADGTRIVSSSNDQTYLETRNSAYFGEASAPTQELTVTSNTPYSCGSETRDVSLTVAATPFSNGTNGLVTLGADKAPSGTLADADYYSLFSVISTAPDESLAVLASGSSSDLTALAGDTNGFEFIGPDDGTTVDGDAFAYLINPVTNVANAPITLFSYAAGYEGAVSTTVDYSLMLPSNLEYTGSFESTVTYTIS